MKRPILIFHKILLFLFILCLGIVPNIVLADHSDLTQGKKVLIVASNHKEDRWCKDIVYALEHELSGSAITVFYMDTKRNLDGAENKAKEAYALYQTIQPDAVVTIDDNAQKYFVLPYLKEKVKTPVVFCGVNDDATKYDFPMETVTGVVETKHFRESISFAQVIQPDIRTIGIMYRPTPSNQSNLEQIEKEKARYSATVIATIPVNSIDDVRKALRDYAAEVDAFILLNLTGIIDDNYKQLEGRDAVAFITAETDLVTIAASDWEVESGALCGVIKTGKEQGTLAAHQLLAFWEGSAIKDIPVVSNKSGKRFINLKTMNKLQIQLEPEMIIGTKVITGD